MTLGIAQHLYLSIAEGKAPWKTPIAPFPWAALYDVLDRALANALGKELEDTSYAILATLCHLSAAVQQGHLCIKVAPSTVSPSISDLFGSVDVDESAVQDLICTGFYRLMEKIGDDHPLLHCDGPRLYFQRHWAAETCFIENLDRLETSGPALSMDQESLAAQLSHLVRQGTLQQEQADAILQVSNHTLTVITGGPGTGKTYTAGQCIRILWLALSPDQRSRFQIALAAPTGKAAANLEASVTKFVGSLEQFPTLKAQTLHSLLGRKRATSSQKQTTALNSDLILVDECSMIDAQLFAQLLAAVKSGARLILMGDAEQLPAVEAGGLFCDLVKAMTGASCLAQLKTCRRTESHDILSFAVAVRQADWHQVQSLFGEGHDVRRLQLTGSLQNQHQQLLRHAMSQFAVDVQSLEDPQTLRQHLGAFRMLSPLRKGPWGVDEINALFHQQASALGIANAPIMITKNDYGKSLFNGDIGIFVRSRDNNDYALFLHEGAVRRISASRLPAYAYAYCLSVHKSQGSEFQNVLLIVPEGSEHFGRGLFYTAATRARSRLEVFGTDETLESMLQQRSERTSGVIDRWQKSSR